MKNGWKGEPPHVTDVPPLMVHLPAKHPFQGKTAWGRRGLCVFRSHIHLGGKPQQELRQKLEAETMEEFACWLVLSHA